MRHRAETRLSMPVPPIPPVGDAVDEVEAEQDRRPRDRAAQEFHLGASGRYRISDRYRPEGDPRNVADLSQPPKIGSDHGGDLRIAAVGLPVGHLDDRPAVARHMDRPHRHPAGDDVVPLRVQQRRSVQEAGRAVAARRDGPGTGEEGGDLSGSEIVVLGAQHHADRVRSASRAKGQSARGVRAREGG